MFKTITAVLSVLLLIAGTTPVLAAPPSQDIVCEQTYSVQADDWLSKLADKFYGDIQAYPAIAVATNMLAESGNEYAAINNPDLIEIGWVLCIPSAADAQAMMEGKIMDGMMMDGDKMADGEMMESDDKMMMGETTVFNVRIENIGDFKFKSSGVFNTPVGAGSPGPLPPGSAYEFTVTATPGDRLSFATMFVPSNDWFIGPGETGIELFDGDGNPISGDITGQLQIWDAGTEIDQEPGLGTDQPPTHGTGAADPNNTVRLADDTFGNQPTVDQLVQATITAAEDNQFVVRLENVSDDTTLVTSDGNSKAVPLTPGVWVVHTENSPLFVEGTADLGQGLEALAEDGDPSQLAAALAAESGLRTPLAPGVWVVHTDADPLFTAGQADRGQGLEALAEDGDPSGLAAAVGGGVFNTPAGADGPGPLLPGEAYEFTVEAVKGDNLSFATMFVQSNDLFYAPGGAGVALFNTDGTSLSGDITNLVQLWDAGTEVNQKPGVGMDQAPRQSGPNTGPTENGVVQVVSDGYTYPQTTNTIRVTITTAQ